MAFTLKEIRTGHTRTFSAKEILELIGDRINDEIVIHHEVYRISSCTELALVSNASIDWVTHEFSIDSNGESAFYNPETISDTDSIFLTINAVLYQYGVEKDFHIESDRLFWHGGFELETSDRMVLRYPKVSLTL